MRRALFAPKRRRTLFALCGFIFARSFDIM